MNHESLIVADTSCLEPVLIKCPLQLSKITNMAWSQKIVPPTKFING